VILAAALAGLIDTHSAAISVASLVASEKMSATDNFAGTFDEYNQQDDYRCA
jgi:hypothetical protein